MVAWNRMNVTQISRLRVAIIGAGPAGFYTAEALLKLHEAVDIDLIERLPTPYGLVRYGVAPDHPEIKSVTRLYDRTATDPRVRFLGNVEYGRDLDHEDLERYYHAIVFAVGSPADRRLGIEGEELPGSISATEFVAWYNGHPDYVDLSPNLSASSVAVIGMGNVAVDVARVLAKSVDELRMTDMANHALDAFAESRVERIYMIGRRGPAQGKFTSKELRELGRLKNAGLIIDPDQLEVDAASGASIEGNVVARRNLIILNELGASHQPSKPRELHLIFLASPKYILGNTRVEALELEANRLEVDPGGYIQAVGTGESFRLETQMVLKSVGYKGTPLPGLAFDSERNVIPNDRGRVLTRAGGKPVTGKYVAGWIKRGPTGVIGTNKADATETVKALLQDELQSPCNSETGRRAVTDLLKARGVRYVEFSDWQKLDLFETESGTAVNRPRVKVTTIDEMLRLSGAR
jgi:ferredoxin--NADP+ reductase